MPPQPNEPPATGDVWSDWLLARRHADDAAYRRQLQADLERYRNRVLDGARLAPGMTLADIGSGDGLIAFGAIARLGPALQVILVDVSEPLLRHAEAEATARGIRAQCTFLHASAEKLAGLADASVDALATRASLAYVADKRAALREFARVLKPGGQLSLAEPIVQDGAFETCGLSKLIAAQPTRPDIDYLRLLHRWQATQFPDTEEGVFHNPLTNFSERDLYGLLCATGFTDTHLELHIDTRPCPTTSWDAFTAVALHPWAPTLQEVLTEQFSPQERQLFERILRPRIESGQYLLTDRIAYLTATKPRA